MINTFQSKVLKFEILTRSMNIPEFKRDITKENIIWLKKNSGDRGALCPPIIMLKWRNALDRLCFINLEKVKNY